MTNSDTAAPLTSTTNFQAKTGEGMALLDEGAATEELAYATGLSGGSLTTPLANRGLEGGSAQAHSASASVKGVLTAGMWNNVIDALTNLVLKTTGLLDTTKVVDLTTAQALTNKTLTSPVINTGVSGTAIDTDGTLAANSDTKIASQKAVKTYVTASIPAANTDGWITVADTWVYASASTFTIAGVDRTAIYTKGTRLKFTQTTAKYAVVVASSFSTNTTVTIAVNTDYVIANAAISSPYYSYQENPQGYPGWFNYTPTWAGFSANPTYSNIRFNIIGNICKTVAQASGNGTSNGTSMTMSLPAPAAQTTTYIGGRAVDNGSILTSPALLTTTATSSTGTWTTWVSGTWTGSGAKSVNWDLSYEI